MTNSTNNQELPLLKSTLLTLMTLLSTQALLADEPTKTEVTYQNNDNIVPPKFELLKKTSEQLYDFEDGRIMAFDKPNYWKVITDVPKTSLSALDIAFSKEAALPWFYILSSTYLLYEYDEDLLKDIQKQGRDLDIGNGDNTTAYLRSGNIVFFRGPSDLGSWMYFIGDGWTHFAIAGGFYYYGHRNNDNRAYQTSLQIIHGMITSTIFSQSLKRATGREAPNHSTEYRGKWRPFPSLEAYWKNTAKYDAMPSGHVMTATLVMTVINENYPEYSHITLTAGSTLITLLALQMVNNGVHWASDYPLGIAMGLVFGKISAKYGRREIKAKDSTSSTAQFNIYPVVAPTWSGLRVAYDF